MVDVPDEIAAEILLRLPVESLIRFKSVCKSWYVLFTNPYFISKHLAYQSQSHYNNLIFLKRQTSNGDDDFKEPMCILSEDNIDDPELVDLPSSIQLCGKGLTLIGHCDGLIALSDGKEGIIVCNPATREFRTLPNSSLGPTIPYDEIVTYGDDGDFLYRYTAYNTFLGLGYDHKIGDYKIVRVVTFCSSVRTHRVEVFCIHTDSCWRQLNVILNSSPPMVGDFDTREPFFDGVCYWWAEDDNTKEKVLISFHVADEVFRKTQVPKLECFEDWATRVSVGVYKNSIALYIYHECCIDIWTIKEFGVKESWSKQLTIKPFTGLFHLHLGFWNGSDKEFLYVEREGYLGQLAIYNRVTMEAKILSLCGLPESWVAVPYMKTIVPVKSMKDVLSIGPVAGVNTI